MLIYLVNLHVIGEAILRPEIREKYFLSFPQNIFLRDREEKFSHNSGLEPQNSPPIISENRFDKEKFNPMEFKQITKCLHHN